LSAGFTGIRHTRRRDRSRNPGFARHPPVRASWLCCQVWNPMTTRLLSSRTSPGPTPDQNWRPGLQPVVHCKPWPPELPDHCWWRPEPRRDTQGIMVLRQSLDGSQQYSTNRLSPLDGLGLSRSWPYAPDAGCRLFRLPGIQSIDHPGFQSHGRSPVVRPQADLQALGDIKPRVCSRLRYALGLSRQCHRRRRIATPCFSTYCPLRKTGLG
jgi:hypothetical protein